MELIWLIYLFSLLLAVTILLCLAKNATLVVNNNTNRNAQLMFLVFISVNLEIYKHWKYTASVHDTHSYTIQTYMFYNFLYSHMYNRIGLFELYTHNLSATIMYFVLFSIYVAKNRGRTQPCIRQNTDWQEISYTHTKKTLQFMSFMNLFLKSVHNQKVCAVWLVAALISSTFCAYSRLNFLFKYNCLSVICSFLGNSPASEF